MLSARNRKRGFTLIELLIGLAIMALLLALGVPSFSKMLQNQKLRATAESTLNGLQSARAEAVKLNVPVEFMLTDSDPNANVNTLTPSTTGANWVIRSFNATTGLYSLVEGKAASSGAGSATLPAVSSTDSIVSFNGFGSTTLAAAATFQITFPAGGACAASSGPMRCLNVVVSPGGQVKMCDPAISAAGDTRKC